MLKDQKIKVITVKKSANFISVVPKLPSEKTAFDLNENGSISQAENQGSADQKDKIVFNSFIHQSLHIKYNILPNEYNMIELENVVESKYCRKLALFKDKLLFNFQEEFLKRYYKLDESRVRIPKCAIYYKNYLTFFCNPTFVELNINDIIQYHGEKQAKVYYSKNFKDKSQNGHNGEGGKRKKDKDPNLGNNTIFSSTVKGNISMNSFSSIAMNQIDSNILNAKGLVQNPSNFCNKSTVETMNEIMRELSPSKPVKKFKPIMRLSIKKLILIKKKNLIEGIDKSLGGKKSPNTYRVCSPQARMERFGEYICQTENSKKQKRFNLSRNMLLTKATNQLYNNNKTDVRISNKRPVMLNNSKVVSKPILKSGKTTNHIKTYSTQITMSERIRTTSLKRKNASKDSPSKQTKYSLKMEPKDPRLLTLGSVSNTSRNNKCLLDKAYLTMENDPKKGTKSKKDDTTKFSMFKTLTLKKIHHKKVISMTKKQSN